VTFVMKGGAVIKGGKQIRPSEVNDSIEVRAATLADASEVVRLLALPGHAQQAGDASR
jgi:hypothetical protein